MPLAPEVWDAPVSSVKEPEDPVVFTEPVLILMAPLSPTVVVPEENVRDPDVPALHD